MLRYLTAGESHGPALTAIVEGFPSGVALDTALIDRELERRQGGYGRGKRQTLETDRVIVDSGVYHGVTTGGPITVRLVNNSGFTLPSVRMALFGLKKGVKLRGAAGKVAAGAPFVVLSDLKAGEARDVTLSFANKGKAPVHFDTEFIA